MSEAAPHKSHATHWTISIVLAVVLYMGSAHPVLYSFYGPKGSWLPRSWEGPVDAFYRPAFWLYTQPPLKKISYRWDEFWMRILDVPLPVY